VSASACMSAVYWLGGINRNGVDREIRHVTLLEAIHQRTALNRDVLR